jgi:hypothetical protein
MKKMMLLASMVALAAMMLAAAPAFAADGDEDGRITVCHVPPAHNFELSIPFSALPGHLGHGDFIGDCNQNQNDNNDNNNNNNNNDNNFAVPVITQDIEQEADSGDIDQSFDVSQTGDNSNQTVGIQGTANTGNAQNAIGVIDAGDFNNNNDGFVFCDRDRDGNDDGDDDCEDFNDGFVICDFDRDGDNDECEDFNNNNDGFVFCDRDHDGRDDGDDDCFVVFPDRNDDGFFNDDGRFIVNDNDDGDEFEIEDSGAEITMSPTNTTNSHQEVNQAAVASAPQWVWTASGWMLV